MSNNDDESDVSNTELTSEDMDDTGGKDSDNGNDCVLGKFCKGCIICKGGGGGGGGGGDDPPPPPPPPSPITMPQMSFAMNMQYEPPPPPPPPPSPNPVTQTCFTSSFGSTFYNSKPYINPIVKDRERIMNGINDFFYRQLNAFDLDDFYETGDRN